jgi:hypothetical protein
MTYVSKYGELGFLYMKKEFVLDNNDKEAIRKQKSKFASIFDA